VAILKIVGVINRSLVMMDNIWVVTGSEANILVEAVAAMFEVTADKLVVQGITLIVEAGILVPFLVASIRYTVVVYT
jgi:hypothetical protein